MKLRLKNMAGTVARPGHDLSSNNYAGLAFAPFSER
jgi:hypothetical protein